MPFAMRAAEIATGKTTSEIFKMMEQGQLLSKDFLVPFAEGLSQVVRENNALQKATQKLTSQQARMGNAWKEVIDDIFQKGGGADLFSNIFQDIASGIEYVTPLVTALSVGFTSTVGAAWDLGVAIMDVVLSLGRLIGDLIGLGSGATGLHVLKGNFYAIKAVIYDVIAGIHEIGELLTGKLDLKWDTSRLTSDAHWKAGAPKTTPINTTNIDTIQINSNASDPKQVADDVMSRLGVEIGMFQ